MRTRAESSARALIGAGPSTCACILTCSGPARRIHAVRSPGRNSAASNRPRSSAPRRCRPRTRGRTCRGPSSPADTGTPADRPGCTARPASRPCSNTCRIHRRRDRCSWGRSSPLEIAVVEIADRTMRAIRSVTAIPVFLGMPTPSPPPLFFPRLYFRLALPRSLPLSVIRPSPVPAPSPSRPGAADCVHGVDEWTNFLNYGIGTIALFPRIPPAPGKL